MHQIRVQEKRKEFRLLSAISTDEMSILQREKYPLVYQSPIDFVIVEYRGFNNERIIYLIIDIWIEWNGIWIPILDA